MGSVETGRGRRFRLPDSRDFYCPNGFNTIIDTKRSELQKSWPALLLLAACLAPAVALGVDVPSAVMTFESQGQVAARNRIDELVFARWKELGIKPANLCSDSVFLRR